MAGGQNYTHFISSIYERETNAEHSPLINQFELKLSPITKNIQIKKRTTYTYRTI